MVSCDSENPIYGIKVSTVVPAKMTGENVVHELSDMDLVMKLHYIKGVYFFNSNSVKEITIYNFKEPIFKCLELYYQTCGRIRRSESGRPFIKCNDSGVRFIEARCNKTIAEWQEMKEYPLHNPFIIDQVLDPDLAFSPLVYLQLTRFKCGGIAIGIKWAHILGDASSASKFMTMWGQIMAGHLPPESFNLPKSQSQTGISQKRSSIANEPLSIKRVEPVGDKWITVSNCKMETYTFRITAGQLNRLQSKISDQTRLFEFVVAVFWKCLAKIREESEPRAVSVCINASRNKESGIFSNKQIVSTVKADFCVAEASTSELEALIALKIVDERNQIEETVERDHGLTDFIVYGAKLTFVDLEDVDIYGFELNGGKPIFANYSVDGVGDEGVVLVLPGQDNVEGGGGGGRGRTVTVILPEKQVSQLKNELKRDWFID